LEEDARKKYIDKCKELEKELLKKADINKELEVQIIANKKRINDLSILKSTNK
jgi:hypothetical protein